jgi:signal transduction histidine kinase/CheY-like chemotaxis protein
MKSNNKPTYQELEKRIAELLSEKQQKENNHSITNTDYRELFNNATISIWNADFTEVFEQLEALKKHNIPDITKYLEQHEDVINKLISSVKVNSVNDATLKLFKAENEQELTQNFDNIFGKGAEQVFINLITAIWTNKKSFTSEVNYKTLQGDEFASLFSIHIPQTKLEQKAVPLSVQSIQKLKDAESAKRDSLVKLEQAQKMGHIGNWEWNSKTDEAVWSDEMYRIYGVEKDKFDPTSENVAKTIIEEDRHKMVHAITQLMQGKLVDAFEFKIIRPNNEVRDLKIIGLEINDGTIFGVTQDITDRKKIETNLHEAQKLAHVGSWLFNPLTYKIEWSEETFKILGFDPAKGEPDFAALVDRIHPDDRTLFNNVVDKAIKLGTPYDIEHRVCLPDGTERVIRAICKPLFGINKEVVSLVGTSQDITSYKLLEQAQVKHQRLKAIGEMSSSIAHDFNNSLQEMMGNLEIVKLENDLSESALVRLNNIAATISDVAERVSALQKFSDTTHKDKSAKLFDLNELIEETLNQSRPLWKDAMEKEGLKINIKTDFKKVPKVNCNSGEVKSAIYNLIKNSVEAMPQGGEIVITTGVKTKGVFATFTDTGIGMNEETKLKIFEPFYSTKGFQSGRGLGMSGVYSIVKKHGGDATVLRSKINEGTTIEIVFPITREQTEENVISDNQPKATGSLNVLWVDDDFLITKSANIMVSSIGHQCKAVNSGQKALDFLDTNICDVVFTDIGMPKMNGWELADAIRDKFGRRIKIVVVTGWEVEDEAKAQHNIDFVLQKPFSLEDLKKAFLQV